ncbi:hypothetical protein CsSME_00000588 [Camellia sinensis var. sinensis]
MAAKALLIFSLSVLILFNAFSSASLSSSSKPDDDEDLSFLEEDDAVSSHPPPDPYQYGGEEYRDFENYDDLEEEEEASDSGDHEAYSMPVVDEKDVVVLKDSNFSDFIAKNRYVMVEFYAPWCGHCQALAPEYAAAATELKSEVVLAKVDATEESELAQKYEIQGFPTVYFFIDGVHKDYSGQRTKDAIVSWVKKKTGPGIYNLSTVEEAEHILTAEPKVVLGFLDSLVGPQSEELSAASRLEEDVSFYQTSSPEVAKLFHIDPQAKRPALVLLKKETEKISHFDGQFIKSAITQFVYENKLPLVTTLTRESAPLIFENPIKNQLLLFATSNDSETFQPMFREAAKAFKGKLIFVYVEMDNEDFGRPVSEYFGVSGDAPRVIAYTGNDDARKFVLDSDLTLSSIKSFGEDFLEDKLKPFYKSDPVPETVSHQHNFCWFSICNMKPL